MRVVSGRIARNTIARLMLPDSKLDRRMGAVTLRDHQAEGVSRILAALEHYGGALLCDEVGLGKTYTAAAVATHAGPAVVIAPAALTMMWRDSLARCGLSSPVISTERFSRSEVGACNAALVIIDEAHHLRNNRTARFRNVAAYIGRAKVLLLSATPVHNRRSDIVSLLSLFLGSRAGELDPADESRCVIRRRLTSLNLADLPARVYCDPVVSAVPDEIRRMLLALPPPVPPRDGDECATLVQFTLLRQWASSTAALTRGLKTRIARAKALVTALQAGTFPTRKELAAWITPEMDVQLGFAELLASPGGSSDLLRAVRAHEAATTKLLRCVENMPSSDAWRANHLRNLRSRYPDRKIVAFTQFASTARALYSLVKSDGRVGLVTSGRCEIASGCVSRQDVISRFAPRGTGCKPPPERESIALLITTDLCSEGLNLQDAGVIVHLDLPWTPARIEQRIGRIARTGSSHREVFIHSLRTPAIEEELLRLDERLRTKEALSNTLGVSEASSSVSIAEANEQVRKLLRGWKRDGVGDPQIPVVAVIESSRNCFVAVIGDESCRELVSDHEHGLSADPRKVLQRLHSFGCVDFPAESSDLHAVIDRIRECINQRQLESRLRLADGDSSFRKFVSREIQHVAHSIPAHRRAVAAVQADQAREALCRFHNIGQEVRILNLSREARDSEGWLREVAALSGDNRKAEPAVRSGFQLLAILVGQVRCRSGATSS
ncbi:MAG: DEAD/DEAH box helicase family protein [Gemmatimonadaceae bacterium]|nr:DEAD/DEAH box helicase family protein [Gemmatimonadaceae bacterium]